MVEETRNENFAFERNIIRFKITSRCGSQCASDKDLTAITITNNIHVGTGIDSLRADDEWRRFGAAVSTRGDQVTRTAREPCERRAG